MKPAHFDCKSEPRKIKKEKHALLLWSALLNYLPSTTFHPPSSISSFFSWPSLLLMSCYSRSVSLTFLKCILFSVLFWMWWLPLCSFAFPLSQYSPGDHLSLFILLYFVLPAFLLSLSLLISLSGSLREPAYTINISWQHATSSPGTGQLWRLHLLSRARVKHQSARYATKANHTTRTIQHGECEELIRSLPEALFTYSRKGVKQTNQKRWKKFHPRPSGEDIPKSKICVHFLFFRRTCHAALETLLSLCSPLEYCHKGWS